jgi:hypothetical protein
VMGVIQKKKIDWSVANPLFIKITIYCILLLLPHLKNHTFC